MPLYSSLGDGVRLSQKKKYTIRNDKEQRFPTRYRKLLQRPDLRIIGVLEKAEQEQVETFKKINRKISKTWERDKYSDIESPEGWAQ